MRKLFGYMFFGSCGVLLNAGLYMLFGAMVAFFALAFSRGAPCPASYTSPKLADFIGSKKESEVFTVGEINEGILGIIMAAARQQARAERQGVSAPDAPVVLFDGENVEVCVPFMATFASNYAKLWARVTLKFNGLSGGVSVVSARIGDALLPLFMANELGKTLLGFYRPLKSLEKYIDAFEKMEVSVVAGTAVLKK